MLAGLGKLRVFTSQFPRSHVLGKNGRPAATLDDYLYWHAQAILLSFAAQRAPARTDEPRPEPERLVDQVGLERVPENLRTRLTSTLRDNLP
jgi:hypothetical protein